MSTKRQNKKIDWAKQEKEANKIAAGYNTSLLKKARVQKPTKQIRILAVIHYELKRRALMEEVTMVELINKIAINYLGKF